jgi:hypothetical protein
MTNLYAAMPVFFDCDKMACNIIEWDDTAGGDGVQADLLSFWRETWTSALLSLHQYPYVLADQVPSKLIATIDSCFIKQICDMETRRRLLLAQYPVICP